MAEDTIECPECHKSIPRSAAKKHALIHWPANIQRVTEYQLARERQEALIAFSENREPRKVEV